MVKRQARVEIPKPGQESVWDYPRPPILERVHHKLRVVFGGLIIGETNQGYRVLETASPPVYYFPPHDVRTVYLALSSKQTACEWKGIACYWSLKTDNGVALHAAWSYPHPTEGYEVIRDYFAFYPSKVDACYVGKQTVRAQAGDFYGGWITPNIVGPFKGEPGTEFW